MCEYEVSKASTPELQYMSPDNTPIEEKLHLRDLGVEISSDLSFTIHIENTVTAANRLVGWSMRSFRRRSKLVMMTIWKSLIQSKLDYCSQLWSPSEQGSISKLESVSRNFTARISGLETADYWDRLKILKMYSQERRRERYRIIFVWKVLQGLVQGYPISSRQSPRRGRLVDVAKFCSSAPAAVKKAREASLSVHGAKLFNLLPRHIRDISTGTTDQFKRELDSWLECVPDQPTTQGRQRAAKTNVLIDQVQSRRCSAFALTYRKCVNIHGMSMYLRKHSCPGHAYMPWAWPCPGHECLRKYIDIPGMFTHLRYVNANAEHLLD